MSGIYGYGNKCEDSLKIGDVRRYCRIFGEYGCEEKCGNYVLGSYSDSISGRDCDSVLNYNIYKGVIDALIYNRREVEKLAGCGSDIEDDMLILRLVCSLGFDALKNVNGDFAGAVLDCSSGTVTLFRDHMGVRSLYVAEVNGKFAFSTDLRAAAAAVDNELTPDKTMLYRKIMGRSGLSADRTAFSEIKMVPAGCYAVYEPEKSPEIHAFWEPGKVKYSFETEQQYIDKMRELVTDAVNIRVDAVSDEPVGAELSGGLDSGVIDIILAKRLGEKGITAQYVSWSLPPEKLPIQEEDERRNVNEVMEICGGELLYAIDCPQKPVFISPLPYFNTLKISYTSAYLSSRGAKTVFSGHGGDEGASHRANIYELWFAGERRAYFSEMWRCTENRKLRILRFLKNSVQNLVSVSYERKQGWSTGISIDNLICADEFIAGMKGEKCPEMTFRYDPCRYIKEGGSRSRPENTLIQGTLNGVRYMFPLLDYRVIDYSLGVPRHMMLNKGKNRYLFREAFRDIIPQSVYEMRRKDEPSYKGLEKIRQPEIAVENSAVDKLDREIWRDIIDFDKLENIFSKAGEEKKFAVLEVLSYCTAVQNVIKGRE